MSELESKENNNEENADVNNDGVDKAIEEETHKTAEEEPNLQDNNEECTVCAEPISKYKPEYFNGVEMNAACESCKSPSVESQIQYEELSEGLATDLPLFSYDVGHRKNEEKIE